MQETRVRIPGPGRSPDEEQLSPAVTAVELVPRAWSCNYRSARVLETALRKEAPTPRSEPPRQSRLLAAGSDSSRGNRASRARRNRP